MNIYSKQQAWKFGLTTVAILIFLFSVLYSNIIVKRIAEEEEKKVILWAEAIKEKAKLVKYTQELFSKLQHEERKRGKLWAEGMKRLITLDSNNDDINFIFEVVKGNETLPVILTDADGKVISSRNLDPLLQSDANYLQSEIKKMKRLYPPIEINILNKTKNYLYYKDSHLFTELKTNLNGLIRSFISEVVINSASLPVIYTDHSQEKILAYGNLGREGITMNDTTYFYSLIQEMKEKKKPLQVELGTGEINYIFYKESTLLTQLKYYPYIEFTIIGIFLIVAYSFFNSNRKSEQNQVWVGMSKETAHQLGTPISSLLAWIELLEDELEDKMPIREMQKDIERLQTIADRFSKIGSTPVLKSHDLKIVIDDSLHYLKKRISKKVTFSTDYQIEGDVQLNLSLFEWVIENITKNAVDAMEGKGHINYTITQNGNQVYLDIADTGKGIPKGKQKTIFEPGFTTKKRGWGLGLTLVKRIIDIYHKGEIFVKKSEQNKGTTFRIILHLAENEKNI